MKFVFPLVGLLVLTCVPLWAEDFQGAEAVLKQLNEQQAKVPAPATPLEQMDEVAKLLHQLQELATDGTKLEPQEAGRRWLELFNACDRHASEVGGNAKLPLRLLDSLPPPAAWHFMAESAESNAGDPDALREIWLRLYLATLRDDLPAQRKEVATLRKRAFATKLNEHQLQPLEGLLQVMEDYVGTDAEHVAALKQELSVREKKGAVNMARPIVHLTDLVGTLGEKKATPLIQRSLALGLYIYGEDSRRVAIQLALKSPDKLRESAWDLVRSPDDFALYEVLARRFPKITSSDRFHAVAIANYLVHLLTQGQVQEAAKLLAESRRSLPEVTGALDDALTVWQGRNPVDRTVRDFLHEQLSAEPGLPFWRNYLEFSANLGEGVQAHAFLAETLARRDVPHRRELLRLQATTLLAADRVEEGVKALCELIGKELLEARADAPPVLNGWGQNLDDDVENSLWLVRLGHVLGRKEWEDEGFHAALTAIRAAGQFDGSDATRVAYALSEAGRGPEAERLLVEALAHVADGSAGTSSRHGFYSVTDCLVRIYHQAGRHEDIIKLLDQSPHWFCGDLEGFAAEMPYETPFLYFVARAFAATDRKEEARRVLLRSLEYRPDFDGSYALLLELGGEDVEAQLDRIAQRDFFEKRPLIWKAKFQLDTGRLGEAEKTARAAIAIDPSDGRSPKGDRMRGFAVLGDILEKKGDAEQAAKVRRVVAAVRKAEEADDCYNAALMKRALKTYEDALGIFSDAYCIQSRLAMYCDDSGDAARAAEHYRRAFELIPDSFGRIETHCFGCEGIFRGALAQKIAAQVLTQRVSQPDAPPQAFYLLGQLLETQLRFDDARAQFVEAVKRDPEYFDAWVKIAGESRVQRELSERATLTLLRLDPGLNHHVVTFHSFHHLPALWEAILAAERAAPAQDHTPLYPLPASAAELERQKRNRPAPPKEPGRFPLAEGHNLMLRESLADHQMLSALNAFLEQVLWDQ